MNYILTAVSELLHSPTFWGIVATVWVVGGVPSSSRPYGPADRS